MHALSDLGVLSDLIGSLSRNNFSLFTPSGVSNVLSKQNKIVGVSSRFETSTKLTLN